MKKFTEKLRLVFTDPALRKRIFFVFLILVIFRLLAHIPIPGIDTVRLAALLGGNQFLGFVNIFSGGGLTNLSIVLLGVGPYITASIIMQLLTIMFPRIKAIYQEEGEAGRAKFTQWSRLLTVPFGLISAFGFLTLLSRQGVLSIANPFDFLVNIIVVVAASVLLMWLGELMTEHGIGNGVSMIIFAGIVSAIPTGLATVVSTYDPSQLPLYLAFIVIAFGVIFSVVLVTEAERPIPVTYAKQVRGMKVYGGTSTYLPLRVNQAGVIPIIFALSFLLFPQMIFNFLSTSTNASVHSIGTFGMGIVNNPWIYDSAYFLLVFLFTYFYTAITFDPIVISQNLQKSGAFIPGVRPGQPTAEYLSKVVTRITLVGALFLGFIAVLPLLMRTATGITTLAVGGTALLIAVSVVLDLVKKLDAQIQMREY